MTRDDSATARLVVQFPRDVAVLVDGADAGRTNRLIPVAVGEHIVTLEGETTEPAEQPVSVPVDGAATEIIRVGFSPVAPTIDRFSPLYCSYNGFLLGQFMTLSFAHFGLEGYPIRRARMLEFLEEVGATVELPEHPPELGSDAHALLLEAALRDLARCSPTLTDFALLGTMLTHYGILAESDPATAKASLEQVDFLREKHELPPGRSVPGVGSRVRTTAISS